MHGTQSDNQLSPLILKQIMWDQVVVSFGWNRDSVGNVLVAREPVLEALARLTADVLHAERDQSDALDHFIESVSYFLRNSGNPSPGLGPRTVMSSKPKLNEVKD